MSLRESRRGSDKRKGLVPAEALPVRSADAAHERAKRLFDTGNYAGVDAFTITADEELGEYDFSTVVHQTFEPI